MLSTNAGTTGNSLKPHAVGAPADRVYLQRGDGGDPPNVANDEDPIGTTGTRCAVTYGQPFSPEQRYAAREYLAKRLDETYERATMLRPHEQIGSAPETPPLARCWTRLRNIGDGL